MHHSFFLCAGLLDLPAVLTLVATTTALAATLSVALLAGGTGTSLAATQGQLGGC